MFDFSSSTRANIQVADQYSISNVLGIRDYGRPSEHEQRELLRGTFEACVRRRARRFASAVLPSREGPGLRVERKTGEGWEEVEEDHPWLGLIRRPNESRSPYVYWKWVSLARDLQGRAPQLVWDDSRGIPEHLYEIYPEFGYVQPLASREGGVDGYIYERDDGRDIRLDPRDIMELKRTDPHSPYETQSLLEALASEVAGDKFASEYRRQTFEQGRPPLVYLSTDENLQRSQKEEYGQRLKQKFFARQGRQKGVPVFDHGMELEDVSIDPESFQMLESQGLDQTVIFRVTGVPQALLDMDSNRAESEEARKEFMRGTIQPLLDEAAQQLTMGLEQAFEPEGTLRVMAPDVTPTSRHDQAETDRILVESGLRTRNEIRERDGKEPFDNEVADQPTAPQGQRPLGSGALLAGQSASDPDADVGDFL